MIDRTKFFDMVRKNPFPGSLKQSQVDGMNFILDCWEAGYEGQDLRWLAYPLATTQWETSSTMQPIEEYGKGSGQPYGKPDPKTGQTYYGRGFVQLTWRDNYARADKELDFVDEESCEWHANNALDPDKAAAIMFVGMTEGWFRKSSDGKPQTLVRWFNATVDDAFNAREIINGDKNKVPSWAAGAKVGDLIAGYHRAFLAALKSAYTPDVEPAPPPATLPTVRLRIERPAEVEVEVEIVVLPSKAALASS